MPAGLAHFRLSLYAKASRNWTLRAALVSDRTGAVLGCTVMPVRGGDGTDWVLYSNVLINTTFASSGAVPEVASLVLTGDPGPVITTLWLDSVSLFPAGAAIGLFRPDLFAALSGLTPAFVRFPGGNYLEGYSNITH